MTERVLDRLIVNGEDLALLGYLALPEQHPRITLCLPMTDSPDDSYAYFATCLGTYWSTWKIKDGCLWLTEIRGSLRLVGEKPLQATWITGTIQASLANDIRSHNDYAYRYEEEMLITIQQGLVQDSTVDVRVNNQGRALDSEEWFRLYLFGYETLFPKKGET
ncbi:MAG: hypothetical protein Q8L77_06310 [Nitrospirota bacterium]|nr:hypothetical protein [Nitrospirota bacterium]